MMVRPALYLIAVVVFTMVFGGVEIVAALLRVPYRPWGIYDRCQRIWARWVLAASGCPVTLEGGAHLTLEEPHLIASNHASFFDILAIAGYLPVPVRFITKKELYRIPFFGQVLRAAGHVRIDRQHAKEAFQAYEQAAAMVRERKLHILVFPEGTRTRTGELQPFKKGPFVLAVSCGAKVVPCYVGGTFGILPKGSIRIRPHPIVLAVGDPISAQGLTYENRDLLASRAEQVVAALKQRVDAAFGGR
jgi:1-acyl-sn-glycerol-3-phosphate acyltransferase